MPTCHANHAWPSLRLRELALEANRITAIAPGDFDGATQLLLVKLGGNTIMSVAAEVRTAAWLRGMHSAGVLPHAWGARPREHGGAGGDNAGTAGWRPSLA